MGRSKTVRGPHYDSVVARNLRALIDREAEGSVNAWATRHRLLQTTVNRIANGSSDCSVSTLLDICTATGYALWQLVRDDFDPRAVPPALDARAMRIAAIYASIKDDATKRIAEAVMEQFAGDQAPADPPPRLLPGPTR
jgi:hypothetical protein